MIQLTPDEVGDSRAGSCSSPNGDIVCDDLSGYPSGAYLSSNGCCFSISPPVKNATYCWSFIALYSTSVTLDSGFGITYTSGFSSGFSSFELYTCTPDCSLVGTGFSYTGLTPGACYTWCFDTYMTGGGAGGGYTFFCPYVILTGTLGVEFTNFDCLPGQEHIQLNWNTSSEENCESYKVMRSGDGINYEEIASIPGNGNTSVQHAYHFTDENPLPGENYYFLQQMDIGNIPSSLTSVITCASNDPVLHEVYYNMVGEPVVDMQASPSGIYIKESITATKKVRQLVYAD